MEERGPHRGKIAKEEVMAPSSFNKFEGKRMRTKFVALIALLSILVAGCAQQDQEQSGGDYYGNQEPVGTPTIEDSPSGTPLSGKVTVVIEGFSYNPESVTIERGTRVTWENQQSVTHTVTSEDGLFDSVDIGQSESYSYTFEEPGTYKYYCTIHPSMEGEIVVVD